MIIDYTGEYGNSMKSTSVYQNMNFKEKKKTSLDKLAEEAKKIKKLLKSLIMI